ncbi:hypothetical protein OB920_13170 [Halobacteria archaeon HArc-gm2]|nr:hypothetical protein [Halobacteria archaeon HArc-gm2]
MDKPDWAQIVQVMYRVSPTEPNTSIDEDHPFVTKTDLDVERASEAAESIESWGLLNRYESRIEDINEETGEQEPMISEYTLTPDGFEVAHERELASRNNDINQSLVFLTFVLVIAQLIGVTPISDAAKLFIGFMILLLMVVVIWKTDLLSEY